MLRVDDIHAFRRDLDLNPSIKKVKYLFYRFSTKIRQKKRAGIKGFFPFKSCSFLLFYIILFYTVFLLKFMLINKRVDLLDGIKKLAERFVVVEGINDVRNEL